MLYYDFVSTFKNEFRRDLLFEENIVGSQIKIDKITTPLGEEDTDFNFWGYKLEKDGVKYLLSAVDDNGKEIKLKDYLPIKAEGLLKIASKGEVFYNISNPKQMKFRPVREMSFKELIDFLSSLDHSTPEKYKLLWLVGFTQLSTRANVRISTPPGFGKDSTVDIFNGLMNNCATIENPTIAKLEERSVYLKHMAINEVVDIAPSEWRTIQQFLLSTGAFKPEVTKHSRAFRNTGEVLDVSDLSLSIMYNDIDCYTDYQEYIDFISKKPLLDRFLPLRLSGSITEKFNGQKNVNPRDFVRENREGYIKLIRAIEYYKQNIRSHAHGYSSSSADEFLNNKHTPERWKTNFGRILLTLDAYSETQEEFEKWVAVLLDSIDDYSEMLSYPHTLEQLYSKMRIPTSALENINNIEQLHRYLLSKKDSKRASFVETVMRETTFRMKNIIMTNYKENKQPKSSDAVW